MTRTETLEVPQVIQLCARRPNVSRVERAADRLFEGEKAVLHLTGEQVASEKRRTPWPNKVWSLRF